MEDLVVVVVYVQCIASQKRDGGAGGGICSYSEAVLQFNF